ncbi:Hypothetical protein SCF082_LOCUS29669 [Durusdinium trenchii]|uniref:Uncharacterized protein n=1 Tax=Durusdinium trenchii TaxID=1381693 RepID=A0ABP0MU78_9DINO
MTKPQDGKETLPVSNNNLADVLGVLRYVHQEVIVEHVAGNPERETRKYDIDAFAHYRMKIRNPDTILKDPSKMAIPGFGGFGAFDFGVATSLDLLEQLVSSGDFVGISKQDSPQINFTHPWYWFSVDGDCPNLPWTCVKPYPGCQEKAPPTMPQPCDPDGCAGKKDQDARSCTDKPQFTDPTDTETARKCCLHYSQHPDQVIIGGLCNSSVKEPTGEIGCVYQYEALTSKDFLPLDDLNGINSMPCGADGKRKCSGWKDWRDHCYDPEGKYKKRFHCEDCHDSGGWNVTTQVTGYCVEYDLHPYCQETQNLCEDPRCMALKPEEKEYGLPFWSGKCTVSGNQLRAEAVASYFLGDPVRNSHWLVDPAACAQPATYLAPPRLGSCEVNGTDGSDAELTARGFMQAWDGFEEQINKSSAVDWHPSPVVLAALGFAGYKYYSRSQQQAKSLVKSTTNFVREILKEADTEADGGIPEARELRKEQEAEIEPRHQKADELVQGAAGTSVQALQLALEMVEALLFQTVKTELAGQYATSSYLTNWRQRIVMARIGEILWTVKDALELARDLQDSRLEATALKALARVHLSRVKEPDAPVAAINEATKALEVFNKLDQELQEDRLHADILFVLGDAQLTKALASPFSEAREESLEAAAATMRQASEVYKKLGETKWLGRSMLGTALALVGLEDEDQQMDGERLAEDAKDLFHDAGELDLEVVAVMLIVKCRIRTSGLDCALLSAEDAAEDWKEETGRPEHVAIALHTAASVYFQLKEGLDRAAQYCAEALQLFRAAEWRRAETAVLQTFCRVESLNQNFDKSIKCAKEAVLNCREMKDQRAEAEALAYQAEAALSKLNTEENTLPTEEAQALADEGKQCSDKARDIFLELGDKEGLQIVDEVTFVSTNVAVEKYCEATPPTRMITTLKSDGHGAQEVFGEWIINRGEEMDPLKVRRLLKDGRCTGPVQYT